MAKKRPQREREEAEAAPQGAGGGLSDTILMWVRKPPIPTKLRFRRQPQLAASFNRDRAGQLSLTCWTPLLATLRYLGARKLRVSFL
jgi:hypothetical protein